MYRHRIPMTLLATMIAAAFATAHAADAPTPVPADQQQTTDAQSADAQNTQSGAQKSRPPAAPRRPARTP